MVYESCAGCYSIILCHVCNLVMLLRLHSCVYTHDKLEEVLPHVKLSNIMQERSWILYFEADIHGYAYQEIMPSLPLLGRLGSPSVLGWLCHYTSPSVRFHVQKFSRIIRFCTRSMPTWQLAPDGCPLTSHWFVLECGRSTLLHINFSACTLL
jgi:hypothetical protein